MIYSGLPIIWEYISQSMAILTTRKKEKRKKEFMEIKRLWHNYNIYTSEGSFL